MMFKDPKKFTEQEQVEGVERHSGHRVGLPDDKVPTIPPSKLKIDAALP